jgi:hypothetical protein
MIGQFQRCVRLGDKILEYHTDIKMGPVEQCHVVCISLALIINEKEKKRDLG